MNDHTCEICKWTNCGCQNLGEVGEPKWVCQHCAKRAVDVLFKLHDFLHNNVGDSADWPISIVADNDEDCTKLCDLLNEVQAATGFKPEVSIP